MHEIDTGRASNSALHLRTLSNMGSAYPQAGQGMLDVCTPAERNVDSDCKSGTNMTDAESLVGKNEAGAQTTSGTSQTLQT